MRLLRRTALLAIVAGIILTLWRAAQRRHAERGVEWDSAPFPFPPVPRTEAGETGEPEEPRDSTTTAVTGAWVEPGGDPVACPATHPVKAKLTSGIFHEPGGRNYDRVKPDRCYTDAAAAKADGLRPPKS